MKKKNNRKKLKTKNLKFLSTTLAVISTVALPTAVFVEEVKRKKSTQNHNVISNRTQSFGNKKLTNYHINKSNWGEYSGKSYEISSKHTITIDPLLLRNKTIRGNRIYFLNLKNIHSNNPSPFMGVKFEAKVFISGVPSEQTLALHTGFFKDSHFNDDLVLMGGNKTMISLSGVSQSNNPGFKRSLPSDTFIMPHSIN